jgi:DNA-binding MarR family transcriptional regulator
MRYARRMAEPEVRLDELLMRAARGLRRGWAHSLEPLSLTPHSARALRVVGELGAPRLGAVAERLHIAPRSATEVIDALVERGAVERVADDADRRATCVVLTEEGRRVLAEVESVQAAAADDAFAALSADDRSELARLLTRMGGAPSTPA